MRSHNRRYQQSKVVYKVLSLSSIPTLESISKRGEKADFFNADQSEDCVFLTCKHPSVYQIHLQEWNQGCLVSTHFMFLVMGANTGNIHTKIQ